ncbi:MAG: type II toxin-antitoxin system VapC family toxin [Polyangiaceae bacterium]|nr:type II toxin-antitoxin system VapC family toxin [Polyangiaceae bacterium]
MKAPRYILDTDICIYIVKRKPPSVLARLERMRAGDAALSVITFGELQFGAAKSRRRDDVLRALDELTAILPVLELPRDAGVHYGVVRAALGAAGRTIGGNDLWIAAHARSMRLTLVTNNEREFSRVAGLAVENLRRSPRMTHLCS